MFKIENPNAVRGPLIVVSSAPRSGTTLLQRLVTSAENGICYGENVANRFFGLSDWMGRNLNNLAGQQERVNTEWAEIRKGNTDFWMPGLELPDNNSQSALMLTLNAYAQYHALCSQKLGKPVWGFKSPQYGLDEVSSLARYVPNTKSIFVYRNIVDVIRSNKARGWCQTPEQLQALCRTWVARNAPVTKLVADGGATVSRDVCAFKYEDLIADIPAAIAKLQTFAGLKNIPPEAASKKINTWDESGSKTDVYLEPEDLDGQEMDTLKTICAETVNVLYPGA